MARRVRYRIVGLLFSGTVINYIDRVNISVAAPVIIAASGWSKSEFGTIFSAFLVGYAVLQLPGGLVADRWSARKVLALAFCGFSLFTALTPPAVSVFWLLLGTRFLIGLFESVTIPALTSLNARWIPRAEFGRAQTLSVSGVTVGQMIAYPLTTWIILHYSWQTVFYFNALLGFVWAAVWLWFATDTPGEHPSIGAGALSDRLLRTGWSTQFARLRFGGFGLAAGLPCLLTATLTDSPFTCALCLVLFYGLFSMGIGVFTTVALEFNPHQSGAIFGMMNTLGTFAGILGPWSAGLMLERTSGNWTLPLFVAAGVGAVSALLLFVVRVRKIELA